jgi:hypothetical protein
VVFYRGKEKLFETIASLIFYGENMHARLYSDIYAPEEYPEP